MAHIASRWNWWFKRHFIDGFHSFRRYFCQYVISNWFGSVPVSCFYPLFYCVSSQYICPFDECLCRYVIIWPSKSLVPATGWGHFSLRQLIIYRERGRSVCPATPFSVYTRSWLGPLCICLFLWDLPFWYMSATLFVLKCSRFHCILDNTQRLDMFSPS